MTDQTTTNDDAANAPSCCDGSTAVRLDVDAATSLAHRLGAIADPVRLQMLSILAGSETGEVCACDFVGPIAKSQPTVSHHLKVLAEAGLVVGDKRGRWVWYRLAPGALDDVTSTLQSVTA